MARPKGTHNRHAAKSGVKERPDPDGYLTRTKRMVAIAFEEWRKKNHLPRYDAWGHPINL